MRILGIDPGMAIVGYGVLDYDGADMSLVSSGSIRTEKGARESARLLEIANDMEYIVQKFKPDIASIEKLFFFRNRTTVMPVAHARGVILSVLEKYGVEIFEYTPSQVKQAVVGYGKAEKRQVMDMTKRLLKLSAVPKPDDAADAVAVALCHARSYTSRLYQP